MRYPNNFPPEWRHPLSLNQPLLFWLYLYLLFWFLEGLEEKQETEKEETEQWKRFQEWKESQHDL